MKHRIIVQAVITIDERDVEAIQAWNPEMVRAVIEELKSIEYSTKIKDHIRIKVTVPVPSANEIYECVNKGRG